MDLQISLTNLIWALFDYDHRYDPLDPTHKPNIAYIPETNTVQIIFQKASHFPGNGNKKFKGEMSCLIRTAVHASGNTLDNVQVGYIKKGYFSQIDRLRGWPYYYK